MLGDTGKERLLDEALSSVKQQSYYLKRAIDGDHLKEALKCSANIISELRTSVLSPKGYYQLYMSIFQELQYLYTFLSEPSRRQRPISELYESVQHAGSIIPRLYLLITVGACYIQSMESPAADILRDLTELCKGVQHPIRGLFLRYYLTQMCKDKLPDTGSPFEAAGGGSIRDAFDLLFSNFSECTNLWIRLQSQSPIREKQKREKERYDLRVLVGANLVCMAQLEGMTVEFYSDVALPKLLEFILECKDTLGQQYLFDCLIQVFSDECHIQTLESLLNAFLMALPSVDLKPIQINLMERLRTFILSDPSNVPEDTGIFQLFRSHIQELMQRPISHNDSAETNGTSTNNTSAITLQTILDLQVSFLDFVLALYPNRVDYVDSILGSTVAFLASKLGEGEKLKNAAVQSAVTLLATPLRHLSLSVLEMSHFPNLMLFLTFATKKQVAISMVDAILDARTPLDDTNSVKKLFFFISPLTSGELNESENEVELGAEQLKISRMLHSISHQDTDIKYEMLQIAYDALAGGGDKRMKYTFPALVFCSLKLIKNIWEREEQSQLESEGAARNIVSIKKVLQFVHRLCIKYVQCDAEVALRMFLQCASVANEAEQRDPGMYEPICYEFVTQSLVCYEDEISDSKSQYSAICMIVGTLCGHLQNLDPENYMTVATKITLHSSKLLKKIDQCRAILMCSHLFWNNLPLRDSRRVLECLQKCLKTTDSFMQSSSEHIEIFVEILDKYIYYFDENNAEITSEFIRNLIALCADHIKYAESELSEHILLHFRNTLNYIKYQIAHHYNFKYSELTLEELEEYKI